MSKRFVFPTIQPVQAELVVRLPDGDYRPPTEEDFEKCGIILREQLYNRRVDLMKQLFGEEEESDEISSFRYFLEYVGYYATSPIPSEALAGGQYIALYLLRESKEKLENQKDEGEKK